MTASTPVLETPRPVLRIDSLDAAVRHYVDWLGFELDWDWREGPGAPAIAAFSRDGFEFMVSESRDTPGPTRIHVNVRNFDALVSELNLRRPGSAQPRTEPPYEFTDLPVEDPFGNVFVFENQDAAALQRRDEVMPLMREFVRQELDAGREFPTPERLREAVGPPLGAAIEVLNEFPDYGDVFRARQSGQTIDDER